MTYLLFKKWEKQTYGRNCIFYQYFSHHSIGCQLKSVFWFSKSWVKKWNKIIYVVIDHGLCEMQGTFSSPNMKYCLGCKYLCSSLKLYHCLYRSQLDQSNYRVSTQKLIFYWRLITQQLLDQFTKLRSALESSSLF